MKVTDLVDGINGLMLKSSGLEDSRLFKALAQSRQLPWSQ
jgi:hypothetical protein